MWGLMFILHVSFELLDSPEVLGTGRTGKARFAGAVRGTIYPVFRSALGS